MIFNKLQPTLLTRFRSVLPLQASKEDTTSTISSLRNQALFTFNIAFILFDSINLYIEYTQGRFELAYITLLAIFFTGLSCFLLFNKQSYIALFISSCTLPSLGFYLAFDQVVPLDGILPQLSVMLLIFIFIIHHEYIRYLYTTLYLLTISILYLGFNPFWSTLPFMLLMTGFTLTILYFVDFLEKQSYQLEQTALTLRKTNSELNASNHRLQLQNKDLQMFGHIMSHDLKTPLRTILSFSALIRSRVVFSTPAHQDYFYHIEDAAESMRILIEDLLLFSEVEQETISNQQISIEAIITDVRTNFVNAPDEPPLMFQIDHLPTVRGNTTLLKILFSNLFSNAQKFQPIHTPSHQPLVRVYARSQDNAHTIFIADNGVGIESQYLHDLFKPFKRFHSAKDYSGTGLGLSICSRIMDKHQGSISLHQTSSRGTTFKLIFPTV